jgi:hypothetical protein
MYRRLLAAKGDDAEQNLINEIRLLDNNEHEKNKKEKHVQNRSIKKKIMDEQSREAEHTGRGYYIETFQSKSARMLKKRDVDIFNYSITTLNGEKVNHLVPGLSYFIAFSARFNEQAEQVTLGVTIYNEHSKYLSSFFSPPSHNPIPHVASGEVQDFSTAFRACLRPGIYGIRMMIKGQDGKSSIGLLAYLIDGILFRILETNTNSNGICDLFV